MLTLHASAMFDFQAIVRLCHIHETDHLKGKQADVSKVVEVRDGAEGLTKEILEAKLLSN